METKKKRINTRSKMHSSNGKIKRELEKLGFNLKFFHMFPHSRFSKDYHLEDCEFDAFGWKDGDKHIYFFQFKSNMKLPKKVAEQYKKLEEKFHIKCVWGNSIDYKGVEFYPAFE